MRADRAYVVRGGRRLKRRHGGHAPNDVRGGRRRHATRKPKLLEKQKGKERKFGRVDIPL